MELNEEQEFYTPRQVAKIVSLDVSTVRKYVDHFEIETEWTKEDQQGHRRYTKENIEEILQIKALVQENKMSWDQAKAHINGKETTFLVETDKTRAEKKQDRQLELSEEILEKQKEQSDFNKALIEQLQKVAQQLDVVTKELAATKQEVSSVKTENEELKKYIDGSLERRDQLLLENIRQTQEQKQEQTKRKKLFGLF